MARNRRICIARQMGIFPAILILAACQALDSPVELVETEFSAQVRQEEECRPIAEEQLAILDIGEEDIESLQIFSDRITVRRSDSERDIIRGYQSWADLAMCDGYLVIEHNLKCGVDRVWTSGDCRVSSPAS